MRKPDLLWKNDIEINKIITITNTLGTVYKRHVPIVHIRSIMVCSLPQHFGITNINR